MCHHHTHTLPYCFSICFWSPILSQHNLSYTSARSHIWGHHYVSVIWYSRSNVLWGCTWDSGAPGGALEARAHRWQVDGRSCARLGDRWRWVLAAGRGCWSPAAPALHAHAHKQGDMHTQSRLSHKEDVLGCAWHRSMLQAGNGMFPWGEGQKNDYMKKGGVFQPQMAGWVQKNKGLMVWTSVPGFKEEYICRFTRPVHTEMSNYFWIAVICRALDQSAAGLWPHIVLDLCLSMCVREVKKGGMEVSLGQHCT